MLRSLSFDFQAGNFGRFELGFREFGGDLRSSFGGWGWLGTC